MVESGCTDLANSTNIQAAVELYYRLVVSGFNYGCFEVSLVALGANICFEEVDRAHKPPVPRIEAIQRHGLFINWIVEPSEILSSDDINQLFSGTIPFEEDYPNREVTGYLWVERYGGGAREHALAVFPDSQGKYLAIDTGSGGRQHTDAETLAMIANNLILSQGQLKIAQIVK